MVKVSLLTAAMAACGMFYTTTPGDLQCGTFASVFMVAFEEQQPTVSMFCYPPSEPGCEVTCDLVMETGPHYVQSLFVEFDLKPIEAQSELYPNSVTIDGNRMAVELPSHLGITGSMYLVRLRFEKCPAWEPNPTKGYPAIFLLHHDAIRPELRPISCQ